MVLQDLFTVLALVGAGGAGGLGTGLFLRRRWSRDRVEIAKDRVEIDLFGAVVTERDYFREETRRLNEAYTECLRGTAALLARTEGDQETIDRLERDAKRLLQYAPDSVRDLLETNFGEFR